MKAADYDTWYRHLRLNPARNTLLTEALKAMDIGATYTVTTFKNLRHRTLTGQLSTVSGTELTVNGKTVSVTDIVRITCPKQQLDF